MSVSYQAMFLEKNTLYKSLYQTEACQFLKFNKQNKKLEINNFFYYHKKINSNKKKIKL